MNRLAATVSIVFHPLACLTWLLAAVLTLHPAWAGGLVLVWAVLVVGPLASFFLGHRRGLWTDLDLANLKERRTYMPLASLFGVGAAALAGAFSLPWGLRVATAAIALWLLISTAIGQGWKISLHAGAAVGAVLLATLMVGGAAWLAAWVPVAVAWSRLALRRHTLAQLLAGGAAAGIAFLAAVRLVGA